VLQTSSNYNRGGGVASVAGVDFLGARNSLGRASLKKRRLLPVRDTCVPAVAAVAAPPAPSLASEPPPSVARRNARERNRVKQVNTGFAVLRQHIPVLCGSTIVYGGSQSAEASGASSTSPNSKKNKMSKVETLRCAVEYIGNLERLLRTGSADGGSTGSEPEVIHDGHVTPISHLDAENISPEHLSFYDSSTSASPEVNQPPHSRFLFPAGRENPPVEALIRSLSCYHEAEQQLPQLLLQDPHPQPEVTGISDTSLLESINSWWCPN